MSQLSCLYPDCKNMELFCFGINYFCGKMNLPIKFHELFNLIACQSITEASADGNKKVVQ